MNNSALDSAVKKSLQLLNVDTRVAEYMVDLHINGSTQEWAMNHLWNNAFYEAVKHYYKESLDKA